MQFGVGRQRFQFWCFGYCGRLRRVEKFIGKSADFPVPNSDSAQ